jgi:hypothetical protein
MKATRTRTLRGTITTTGTSAKRQLIVDDGLINRGYKVTGFFVWSALAGSSFVATLSMNPKIVGNGMQAGDNSEIGWTFADGNLNSYQRILDPDHIIVRDLYVTLESVSASEDFNFMIVVEEYSITDEEAIINIIKEGSQSLD